MKRRFRNTRIICFRRYDINNVNITEVIELSREPLRKIIDNYIQEMKNIKFKTTNEIKYQNPIEEIEIEFYHNSKFSASVNETKILIQKLIHIGINYKKIQIIN